MPILSPKRAAIPTLLNLPRPYRGKVADSYDIDDGLMLVVRTDAISIFDFVLDAMVPGKGHVLNAMTHFWLTRLKEARGIKHHLVAAGAGIDEYLPVHLRHHPDLQSRAMVVKKLQMVPVEFVVRGYLTGSGWTSYGATGEVCGVKLPQGLRDGDELDGGPILTPTTKAEQGHDAAIDAQGIMRAYPKESRLSIEAYRYLAGMARQHGFLMADTKFEFGRDEEGNVVLGDEVGTPDSSRFWDHSAWNETRGEEVPKPPPPFDKQRVRDWGKTEGIHKMSPESSEDVARVHRLVVPEGILKETAALYFRVFFKITGYSVDRYLRTVLGVKTPEAG